MKVLVLFFITISFFLIASYTHASSDATASSASKSVVYELPYPGLLPDSPLYSLKMLRDRISEFLITDSLKKTEFYMLQADKRLQTGVALLMKRRNKEKLALSTISKGQNYFEKAFGSLSSAKREGKDALYLMERITLSLKKHEETLASYQKKIPPSYLREFTILQERIVRFESIAAKL